MIQQPSVRPVRPAVWFDRSAVAGVLAIAAALRFWNLTVGYPYRIGVDEPVIAERAIHMMRTGDFNPHFFDYPGLYIYMQLLVGCARFLKGAADGAWRSLDEFSPDHLFIWTRALSAVMGTATILVIYRAGLRWGRWVALLAAFLLAVWPNHVRESHFALTDIPLTLFSTLALVLSLRALETRRMGWFLAAGATVGFAAATKYNGIVALVMPLIAAAAGGRPLSHRVRHATAAVGASAVAFLIGAPYTVLDLPGFLNAFGYLMHLFRPRTFASGAEIYLGHLKVAAGWLGVVVAGAGMIWGVFRALRDREFAKWGIILVCPLVYFNMFATKFQIYGRYLLPIVPFLCLFMAIVIVGLLGWVSRLKQPLWVRQAAGIAFAAVVLFPLVTTGIAWPREYGRPTTQDVAYPMIREFIPEGSKVAVERSVLRLPDFVYQGVDFRELIHQSPDQYLSSGITYFIASSDAFGPILANQNDHPDIYQAYQRLFHEASDCLPAVQPTASVTGPQILICRLKN